MTKSHEINLAHRVLQKFNLVPPIDIWTLVSQYAVVQAINLPLDIDGVSLNLKVPGRRPFVIVNDSRPSTRKRFTLAHELGHVLIPWHIGTILDEIEFSDDKRDLSYWELENEANRFAAELLMPEEWVRRWLDRFEDPCKILNYIIDEAHVSMEAALIRLKTILHRGYVYASINDEGLVLSSGRSEGTLVTAPERGGYLDRDMAYPGCDARWESRIRDRVWVWWRFPNVINPPATPDGFDWRQALDRILLDLSLDPASSAKMKQSINGIIGFIHGSLKRDGDHGNSEALYAAAMQRFGSRSLTDPIFRACVAHSDFPIYLAARVNDLLRKG